MKSLNSKDYLSITIAGIVLSFALILFGIAGIEGYVFVLLCVLALALAIANPRMLFWLFLVLLPLDTVIVSPEWFVVNLRPFQLFGAVAIVATVFHHFFRTLDFKLLSFGNNCPICSKFCSKKGKKDQPKKSFNKFDHLVFVFAVFAVLPIIFSSGGAESLKMTVVFVSFVLLFWLVRNYVQNKQEALEALWFFAVGTVPVLLFGFFQAVADFLSLESFEIFEKRVNSTFTEPDWFGMFLSILIALILWFRLALLQKKDSIMIGNYPFVKMLRWASLGDLFLVSTLILLTVSRSAWLGWGTVLMIYFVLVFIRKKTAFFGKILFFGKEALIQAAIIVLAVTFVWGIGLSKFHFFNRAASSVSGMQKITISCEDEAVFFESIQSVEELARFGCFHINLEEIEQQKKSGRVVREVFRPDPNVDVRKKIYLATWTQIKEHPLVGQGLGASAAILGTDEHGSAHNASNIFLETWLSMGLGGLIVLLALFFAPVFWALRNFFKDQLITEASFVLLTFGAIFIPNLFNSGLLLGVFWIWLAIVSFLMTLNKAQKKDQN